MRAILKTFLTWLITVVTGSLLRCGLYLLYNGHIGDIGAGGFLTLLIEGALLLIPGMIFFHMAGRSIWRMQVSKNLKKIYLSVLSLLIIYAGMLIVLQPPFRPWPLLQVFTFYCLPYSVPWIVCVWVLL